MRRAVAVVVVVLLIAGGVTAFVVLSSSKSAAPALVHVSITDLPAGASAKVEFTPVGKAPGGSATIEGASGQTVSLPPGSYDAYAPPLPHGSDTYYAVTMTSTLRVLSELPYSYTADYADIVPSTTKAISASELAQATLKDGVLTVPESAAGGIAAGDVLVLPLSAITPAGSVDKVVSRLDGATDTALKLSPASLSEAFPRGQVNFDLGSVPVASNPATTISATTTTTLALPVKPQAGGDVLVSEDLSNGFSGGKGNCPTSVRPSVDVSMSLGAQLQDGWGPSGPDLLVATELHGVANAGVSASVSSDCSVSVTSAAEALSSPKAVAIGPFSVYVSPSVTWKASLSLDGSSDGSLETSSSGTLRTGFSYVSGKGHVTSATAQLVPRIVGTPAGRLGGTLQVSPQMTFPLDGLPATTFAAADTLQPALGALGSHTKTNLAASFEVTGSADLSPFGADKTYSASLYKTSSSLAYGGGWSQGSDLGHPALLNDEGLPFLSCTVPTFCLSFAGPKVSYLYDGDSWKSRGGISQPVHALTSVSCTSITACWAVGEEGTRVSGSLLKDDEILQVNDYAVQWTSKGFQTPVEIASYGDVPESGTAAYFPRAVSCAGASFCMALTGNGSSMWNGRAWAPVSGAPADSNGSGTLSCVTSSFCMAAGSGGYAVWNGSTWGAQSSLGLPGSSYLTSVSCTATSFCAGASNGGQLETWNGSAWHQAADTNVSGVASVSCGSASFCIATTANGSYNLWSGTSFGPAFPFTSGASGVSCVPGFCMAMTTTGTGGALQYSPAT